MNRSCRILINLGFRTGSKPMRVSSNYTVDATAGINQKTVEKTSPSKYGGRYQVAAILGDGMGPEFIGYVKRIFNLANVPIDFEDVPLSGMTTNPRDLTNAILSVQRNGIALKGNVETLEVPGFKSLNVELRSKLDLFANVLVCKSIENVPARHKGIDIVCIRENTEGEYSSLEHESVPGVVESLKIITAKKSRRIAKYAFDYAVRNQRKKVTAVHKANIMKEADGLFLNCCRETAKQYPNIEFNDKIIDNMCMQLVKDPQQFDVILLPNLYGNIVANVCTGLVGGAGVVSGSNIGEKCAVFETGARNTGATLVGKNSANPCAMILAAADMLTYLNLSMHGDLIRSAVYRVITKDKIHTPDLGGQATTTDVVDAIQRNIETELTH